MEAIEPCIWNKFEKNVFENLAATNNRRINIKRSTKSSLLRINSTMKREKRNLSFKIWPEKEGMVSCYELWTWRGLLIHCYQMMSFLSRKLNSSSRQTVIPFRRSWLFTLTRTFLVLLACHNVTVDTLSKWGTEGYYFAKSEKPTPSLQLKPSGCSTSLVKFISSW